MDGGCLGLFLAHELLHTEQTTLHYKQQICCLKSTQEMRENKWIINVCDCARPWTKVNCDDKSIFLNRRGFRGSRNQPAKGETLRGDTKHRVLRNVPRYSGTKETSWQRGSAWEAAEWKNALEQTVGLNLCGSQLQLHFHTNKPKPKPCSHTGYWSTRWGKLVLFYCESALVARLLLILLLLLIVLLDNKWYIVRYYIMLYYIILYSVT